MARRGRKRVAEAKRRQTTRAGQGRVDRGTPELTQRREDMHGMPSISTDYPLDILAARRLLAPQLDGEPLGDWDHRNIVLRDSGAKYATLYRRVFPSTDKAVDPNAVRGGAGEQETAADRLTAQRLRQAREALLGASRRVLDVVANVAIYGRSLPDARTRPAQHVRELSALRQGLTILADLPAFTTVAEAAEAA